MLWIFQGFFQIFQVFFQAFSAVLGNAIQEEKAQKEVVISLKQTFKSQKQRSQKRREEIQVEKSSVVRNSQRKQQISFERQTISLKSKLKKEKQIPFEISCESFPIRKPKPRQQTRGSSSAIAEGKEKSGSKSGNESSTANVARRCAERFKIQVRNHQHEPWRCRYLLVSQTHTDLHTHSFLFLL